VGVAIFLGVIRQVGTFSFVHSIHFFYQLMDNLDGKQARRTGSSSALGELFDHGCDSLYITSMTVCLISAMQLSPWEQLILAITGLTIFYASHWEEYHTNHLILGRYANPTEVQVAMMIILVIAGIGGTEVYTTPLSEVVGGLPEMLGSLSLRKLVVLFTLGACFYTLAHNAIKVTAFVKKHNKSIYHGFSPIIPMFLLMALMSVWAYKSNFKIMDSLSLYTHLFMGLLSSFICDELVICRITKMEFKPLRPVLILPLIGTLNVALTSSPIIPEEYLLPALLVVMIFIYVYILLSIVQQLTYWLGIYVFWIPPVSKIKPT